MLLLEEQRLLHEDLERLEDAIAERLLDNETDIRKRLASEHDVARFMETIEERSKRLKSVYEDVDGQKDEELRKITMGDPMESFLAELEQIKDFHRRYPDERVENLEKAYKRRGPEDFAASRAYVEKLFTGEEGYGLYFDMTMLHEQYLNLPVNHQGRRLTYLQFLSVFDSFLPPHCNIRRDQKMSDAYFQYLKALKDYLEGFMRRTRPKENVDKILSDFDREFEELWKKDEVPGWETKVPQTTTQDGDATGEGIFCTACNKAFAKETVFEAHLNGKKHKKAVEASQANETSASKAAVVSPEIQRLKQRVVAEAEFRIQKLAAAMSEVRGATKSNVERKQGMTERERQQELETLYAEELEGGEDTKEGEAEADGQEKLYNPLNLPLAWDGKPIPYWLFKLHGLGNEHPCEICGNHVYMGRRAFDKHFNEPRHVYGLKCLGINNSPLYRDIIHIDEAVELAKKLALQDKKQLNVEENVIEMEDHEGNVMPEKIYRDLEAQGML
ncbi:splicing factor 3a [Massariosphaeria phaeospora]|uniref:Splicing factor 3a n=1 Tax=Massariosphaeria phaeospora TaxID=100035 RepID=A0A7C8HZ44_9PLEO|nr:splicing factor 3a [Massariosphaeria phaeospora]